MSDGPTSTGRDSPVREDWSTDNAPLRTLASAGTMLPICTTATSPGTISDAAMVTHLPPRRTAALTASSFLQELEGFL